MKINEMVERGDRVSVHGLDYEFNVERMDVVDGVVRVLTVQEYKGRTYYVSIRHSTITRVRKLSK